MTIPEATVAFNLLLDKIEQIAFDLDKKLNKVNRDNIGCSIILALEAATANMRDWYLNL